LPTSKYEKYRKAWHLLREAAELGEEAESAGNSAEIESDACCSASESDTSKPAASEPAPRAFPANALGRMEAAANYYRRYLEGGVDRPQKEREEV